MHEADETILPDAQADWLVWLDPNDADESCLACDHTGPLTTRVSVRNPFGDTPITYAQCPQCGSLTGLDFTAPEYRDEGDGAFALKFAKEQGAGITAMIAPLYWVDRSEVGNFLDVGGGYGFALDAARRLFGWQVHGADPSYFARVGAREFGLTIEDRYVSEASPAEGGPYDLVLASEVIEHVDDPVDFARVLRACASVDGRIILTTPCAEDALNREDEARALMALAPGSHAGVFSEVGLETILKAAGFKFVAIIRREGGLVAAAGATEFGFDPGLDVPATDFETYLAASIDAVEPGSDLQIGLQMRLCRQHANAARWDLVRSLLGQLNEHFGARYGIDLLSPEAFEPQPTKDFVAFAKRYPFCLGPAFFVLGLVRLIDEADRPAARHAFEAAYRASNQARTALIGIGADDIDLAVHERRARILQAQVLAWIDVDEAATLFVEEWALSETKSDEHIEALVQICDVASRKQGASIHQVFDIAETWVQPVVLGQRNGARREDVILLTLAQRYAWLGEPVRAHRFALAARDHARRSETSATATDLLEDMGSAVELAGIERDRQILVDAMDAGQPDDAGAAAHRMFQRGPHDENLRLEDRRAVASWCLGPADKPEQAVEFLTPLSPDDRALDRALEQLLAMARGRLSDPNYVFARMGTMASVGDWDGFAGLLGAIDPSLLEAIPAEAAFALAMYQLNAAGDPGAAAELFARAETSRDEVISGSARVHHALSLHRAGKKTQALDAAAALGEELAQAPSGPLASHNGTIKSLIETLTDQVQDA